MYIFIYFLQLLFFSLIKLTLYFHDNVFLFITKPPLIEIYFMELYLWYISWYELMRFVMYFVISIWHIAELHIITCHVLIFSSSVYVLSISRDFFNVNIHVLNICLGFFIVNSHVSNVWRHFFNVNRLLLKFWRNFFPCNIVLRWLYS